MTEANERQGLRNKNAGKKWQQDCASWLRVNGWPSAGYEIRNHSGDLTGTWDLSVECTITGWDKLWIKLGQALKDAQERGLSDFCVWKKRTGTTDPGNGAVIMRAREFFPLIMRLEKLEHADLEAADAYDRGYRNGQNAARKEAVS